MLLAVESSCDETAAAVMDGPPRLLSSVVASQAVMHAAYGGVVPEVASREHLLQVGPVIERALAEAGVSWTDVQAVAGTTGPGLASALLVGAAAGKGLALALGCPFLAINHVEGHLLSPFFGKEEIPPAIGLVVSGGHTLLVDIEAAGRYRLLGRTLDDAAGEAYDKVAKLLGLGYPGGPEVEALAHEGLATRFTLPRSMMNSGDLHFSFSGLKTAVRYLLAEVGGDARADLCASFQEAVVDVLVDKTLAAARLVGRKIIAVSGGVGLNQRLRERLSEAGVAAGCEVVFAEPWLCGDNAAMIAFAAVHRWRAGAVSGLGEDIFPSLDSDFFHQ